MSTLYVFVASPGIGSGCLGQHLSMTVHYELRTWMPEILATLQAGKPVATFTTPLGLADKDVSEFLGGLCGSYDIYLFDATRMSTGFRL